MPEILLDEDQKAVLVRHVREAQQALAVLTEFAKESGMADAELAQNVLAVTEYRLADISELLKVPSETEARVRERSAALLAIAAAIEAKANQLAVVESRNAGKPLRFVKAGELVNVADVFRFYGTAVRNMPAPAAGNYRSSTRTSLVRRDPIGVIAQIAPWNYPLLMAAWKIAPAIAAGNAVVIKPSEMTPLSLLALSEIFADLLPPGVVNVICGNGPAIRISSSMPCINYNFSYFY